MSRHIEQSAGDARVSVWTNGWPRFFDIEIARETSARVEVECLHDLRYCIDRVLSQLAEEDTRP
jgi:hypothetical protein